MKHDFNCFHPVIFKNKDGQLQMVPCGKCDYCLANKQSSLIDRLKMDCNSYKYLAFVTLTFSEQHVPKAYMIDDVAVSIPTGLITDPVIVKDFYNACLPNEDFVRVLDYSLLQKFIKRLRNIYAKRKKNEVIRYFAVGEYGSQFRRPHYHLLLSFNDEGQAASLEEDIHQSWKFGFSNIQFADCNSVKYVAKYINKSNDLPSFYSCEEIRQKSLFSKSTAIGLCSYSTKDFEKMFNSTAHEVCIPSRHKERASCYVPLWRSLQDRLYPKIKGFSELDHSERVAIYAIYQNFHLIQDVVDFESYYKEHIDDNIFVCQCLKKAGFCDEHFYSDSEFRSLFYLSRKVCKNCDLFGLSVESYVSKIELYYEEIKYNNLMEQLRYLEQKSFELHKLGIPDHEIIYNLMFIYSIFVQYLLFKDRVFDTHLLFDYLAGEDPDSIVMKYDYRKTLDYRSCFARHVKLRRDSVRSKKQKSYINNW